MTEVQEKKFYEVMTLVMKYGSDKYHAGVNRTGSNEEIDALFTTICEAITIIVENAY